METIVHPIDTIRTRIKSNTSEYVSFVSQAKKMYNTEGLGTFYRGYTCTLFCATFARGLYFWVYEKLKIQFQQSEYLHFHVGPFIAGFIGGLVGDIVEAPCDLVRTRMQLAGG
jgi:hypothetical protein